METLRDKLEELERESVDRSNGCVVAQFANGLDDESKEVFIRVLAGTAVSHAKLRRVILDSGGRVGETSIRRHRNHECCCEVT